VSQGRRMAARTPRTMLVVDDAPSLVRGRTRLLRHAGYAVAVARHGCAILAQRHQRPYAVILTDLRMPTLDGCAAPAALACLVPAGALVFLGGARTPTARRVWRSVAARGSRSPPRGRHSAALCRRRSGPPLPREEIVCRHRC
jgi:response regulator RpfG family c-di-GMP phosphodiesterase